MGVSAVWFNQDSRHNRDTLYGSDCEVGKDGRDDGVRRNSSSIAIN